MPKATNTPSERRIPYRHINPLIDDDGDPMPVASVLRFLSFTLQEIGDVSLGSGDTIGLGYILETCAAAIENTPMAVSQKGGAA